MLFADKLTTIIQILENDGVILHPTDTIWGLGCCVYSEKAIEKIYTLKNRKRDMSLIILVSSIEMLKKYVDDIHPRVETLLSYHQRPLTVVYRKPKNIPDYALANDGSVAIRVISDEYCKEIIELLGYPLVSTSANISGSPHPLRRAEIDPKILSTVDFVAEHRKDEVLDFPPSVLISFNKKGKINFLRS